MNWFSMNRFLILFVWQLIIVRSEDPPAATEAPAAPPASEAPVATIETTTTTAAPETTTVETGPLVVPECPYKTDDKGSYICPATKSKGSIPKLMQCSNKLKIEFQKLCKNKPPPELLTKFKAQCVDVCLMPCVPEEIFPLLTECAKMEDISNPDMMNIDMFCDPQKQKEGKECGTKLFKTHKTKYMDTFNKKIHVLCKQCQDFAACFKRLQTEIPK